MNETLIYSMRSMMPSLKAMLSFVTHELAWLIGAVVFIGSLLYLIGTNRGFTSGTGITSQEIKGAITGLLVGAFLMAIPEMVEIISNTAGLQGSQARQAVLGATTLDASTVSSAASSLFRVFMAVTGVIAMIKGFLIINAWGKGVANERPSTGINYIVGGILTINAYQIAHAIVNSLGNLGLKTLIEAIIGTS